MSDFQTGSPLWAKYVNSVNTTFRTPPKHPWQLPEGKERLPPPQNAADDCPLPYDWDSRRYVAFDVETTGLESWRHRIVEIGLVLFHFDEEGALIVENDWGTLVNPCMPIPASATEIHGISDLDVQNSPRFSDIASELTDKLIGRVLVAHNAPFDASFLESEYSRIKSAPPVMEIADSLSLLRLAVPNLLSYNLGKAAYILGINSGTSHRALDDAITCMQIFARSARILAGRCP